MIIFGRSPERYPRIHEPVCYTYFYPFSNSLLMWTRGGWNHSALLFMSFLPLLLIRTPSLICLVRQSLLLCVTFATKLSSSPSCFSLICLLINESSSFLILMCSPPLVYIFLDVSPIYTAGFASSQSLHAIS